jgi:hypothetical protein
VNIGVEIGKALVVAIALPALLLLGKKGWAPRMVWTSSVAVLVAGLILFVERAFL